MLRREYHAKDSDMAEKDRFVQQRINSLKEWKANAMTQLQFLFQKLRIAVPVSELQSCQKKLEMETQKTSDYSARNAKLVDQVSKLQKQIRENDEADEKLKAVKEDKEVVEQEFFIVKKRLEDLDPVYKWENAIYQKIANMLKRAQVSPLQAFEAFDADKNGTLCKQEFIDALEQKMRLYDMSHHEMSRLFDSLDANGDGKVDYHEFVRKLQQYGVRNLGRDEFILYQLAKTMQKINMSMADFFGMVDKQERGYISREDFIETFNHIKGQSGLKLNEAELNSFIDNFWRDNTAGIDYKGFLRIFAKYEIRVADEAKAKRGPGQRVVIKDATVRLRKHIFDELKVCLDHAGQTINDLFKMVDADQSFGLSIDELFGAFQEMQLNVTRAQTEQIFASIDFDGDGELSIGELIASFRDTTMSEEHILVQRNQAEQQDLQEAQDHVYLYSLGDNMGVPDGEAKQIQMKNRISQLEARERFLQKQYAQQKDIVRQTETHYHQLKI